MRPVSANSRDVDKVYVYGYHAAYFGKFALRRLIVNLQYAPLLTRYTPRHKTKER